MGEAPIRPIKSLSDKGELRRLRDLMDAMLAGMGTYGVGVKTGNIRFEGDGSACTIQIKCVIADETGRIVPEHEKNFHRYHQMFSHRGLLPEHLGAVVEWGPHKYKILGLRPSAHKYPLLTERLSDLKRICLPVEAVRKVAR